MNALISVSDKTGIVDFAKELQALGIEIISTGGTYKKLKDEGLKVFQNARKNAHWGRKKMCKN